MQILPRLHIVNLCFLFPRCGDKKVTWKELSEKKSLQERLKEQQKPSQVRGWEGAGSPHTLPRIQLGGQGRDLAHRLENQGHTENPGRGMSQWQSWEQNWGFSLLSCKAELPSIPDLCPDEKKTNQTHGMKWVLKKKLEFLQASPLKHNVGSETSFKNNINKLFCGRIIYHEKR